MVGDATRCWVIFFFLCQLIGSLYFDLFWFWSNWLCYVFKLCFILRVCCLLFFGLCSFLGSFFVIVRYLVWFLGVWCKFDVRECSWFVILGDLSWDHGLWLFLGLYASLLALSNWVDFHPSSLNKKFLIKKSFLKWLLILYVK